MQLKRKFKKLVNHVPNPEILEKSKSWFRFEPSYDRSIIHPHKSTIDELEDIYLKLNSMIENEVRFRDDLLDQNRDRLFLKISKIKNDVRDLCKEYREFTAPLGK